MKKLSLALLVLIVGGLVGCDSHSRAWQEYWDKTQREYDSLEADQKSLSAKPKDSISDIDRQRLLARFTYDYDEMENILELHAKMLSE